MKQVRTIKEVRDVLKEVRRSGKSIGFVPTMGYLHDGHASLLKEARKENDFVVLSIFVNPTQFGPNEDLDAYPRDIERDLAIATERGTDLVFFPEVSEMYNDKKTVKVAAVSRTDVLCGSSRPGHFDGVVTVVSKLFNIVNPTKAYFGKKDAQQLAVIEGLVEDLNFDIEIVGCPIKRDDDGLALSSRNVRLTEAERANAPIIYMNIAEMAERAKSAGVSVDAIRAAGLELFKSNCEGEVDYLEFYQYPEFTKATAESKKLILAVAVKYSVVRLIDNVIFERVEM